MIEADSSKQAMIYLNFKRYFCSLLPAQKCLLCDVYNDQNRGSALLCDACLADLPLITNPCRICSVPVGIFDRSAVCGECLQNTPFFHSSTIPFSYDFPIKNMIKSLKYNGNIAYSRLFSELILGALSSRISPLPDALIPVPLHSFRLMKRGFNQSELIAKALGRVVNLPIDTDSCKRITNTRHQTGFSKNERRKNLQGAFSVSRAIPWKHVAIVDDVVTTGATTNELSRTLADAGVETIEVWACARTV